jgi:hypothetical protein
MLKTIDSDFTFDHKKGIGHVLSAKKVDGMNYFSIDLTAATDRIPRLLQAEILSSVFSLLGFNGRSIADQWLIIVDREFKTEGSKLNHGLPIKYEVGQGMGIFTSWPIMALFHHFVINGICGVTTDRYALVGDDLFFYGTNEEFDRYIGFMTSIGVSVNKGKTVISRDADSPTIEFARNFVVDGIKLKPFKYGILFA